MHVPLFTAFAPPSIGLQLQSSDATVVVVDADQQEASVQGEALLVDQTWTTIAVGGVTRGSELSFERLLAEHRGDDAAGAAAVLGSQGTLVHLFTTGTTGCPQAVAVTVEALASLHTCLESGRDELEGEVSWNAADPAWVRPVLRHPRRARRRTAQRASACELSADPTWRTMTHPGATVPPEVQLRRATSAGEPLTPQVSTGRRLASPLCCFDGHVHVPKKTAERVTSNGRWSLTGDAGNEDQAGFRCFSARNDDVINEAGDRIRSFDVESVLVMHDQVVEAGRPRQQPLVWAACPDVTPMISSRSRARAFMSRLPCAPLAAADADELTLHRRCLDIGGQVRFADVVDDDVDASSGGEVTMRRTVGR